MNKETVKCISIAEKPSNFGVMFHNLGYEMLGINYIYIPLKISSLHLESIIHIIRDNFRGASVSMPYKVKIMEYLDELDNSASKIGAVNTILNKNRILIGYNTDYYGTKKAIETNLDIKEKDVVMIGAGGVARAIGNVVKDLGGKLLIVNRTYDKGRELADKLDFRVIDYKALEDARGYLLINATSLGMNREDEMPVSEELLSKFGAVVDVVVGETKLISKAKELEKIVIPGRLMTVYQAAEQFKIYTGKELSGKFLRGFYE